MKNFLYDLIATQPNVDGAFHGGGKYGKKLFIELLKHDNQNEWAIYGLYDSSKHLDNETTKWAADNNVTLIDAKNKLLPAIVQEYSINRFYTSLPFGIMVYGFNDIIGKCEVYVTVHGLRTLETAFPISGLSYASSYKEKAKLLAKKALEKKFFDRDSERYFSLIKDTNVITVSNHTKFSVMAFFPSASSDIKVFYSPDVTEFEDPTVDEKIADFKESNYFLMVSGNRWLKNNMQSALALDKLFTDRPDITQKVIITGVSDPGIYLKKLKNPQRFTFYKYVSEGLLNVLYKNAYAFVYMSLNEGFGYPPLEAMKVGVPVITSPFTSIPEICGDAVLYSDPNSVYEIINRVLQVLDKDIYKSLSEKGLERYSYIRQKQDSDLTLTIEYLVK
jgi:glycosyltransferase involved in cell wall biosynthesis